MKLLKTLSVAVILSASALTATTTFADIREKGREVVQKHADALISVEVVSEAKFSYGGQQTERESKNQVNGIALNPEGLVLVPLSELDPASLAERISPGEEADFTITIKSIRYILADGTEVPAKLVLRDNDLDLAFLQPEAALEKPMAAIDFSVEATAPKLLDPVMALARAGRVAGRAPLGMSGELQGVVEKPQTYYIPSSELVSSGSGVPIFNEGGQVIGVVLIRVLTGGRNVSMDGESPYLYVVVPNLEIFDASEQIE
ncbi:MAG: serine protease [Sumerlaeia bacterium]